MSLGSFRETPSEPRSWEAGTLPNQGEIIIEAIDRDTATLRLTDVKLDRELSGEGEGIAAGSAIINGTITVIRTDR
jgi:hypothetical protein